MQFTKMLRKRYDSVSRDIDIALKEAIEKSNHKSDWIQGVNCIQVDIQEYVEIVRHANTTLLINADGNHYSSELITIEEKLEILESIK